MSTQTSSASLTEISSKSYKHALEIKICIRCFTGIQHCSQMLQGLNSYLKSKDILQMTSELRPLGIWGNLLNWKLGTAEKPELVPSNKRKCHANTQKVPSSNWGRTWQVTKRSKYWGIAIWKIWMVIYTHKTYTQPPNLNVVPLKSSSTMHNFKIPCTFLSWQHSFTYLNLSNSSFS